MTEPEMPRRIKRSVTDLQAENQLLRDRIEALDQLLVCYRLGRQPTEELHRQLRRTAKAVKGMGVS